MRILPEKGGKQLVRGVSGNRSHTEFSYDYWKTNTTKDALETKQTQWYYTLINMDTLKSGTPKSARSKENEASKSSIVFGPVA